MKIYVNSYKSQSGANNGAHEGYEYFASKRKAAHARAERRKEGSRAELYMTWNIPLTKKGILDALNRFGSHPENG